MRLIANNDGTWSAHDETYDIIIRCGTKEEDACGKWKAEENRGR